MNSHSLALHSCLALALAGGATMADELTVAFDQLTPIPDNSGASVALAEFEVSVSDQPRIVTDARLSLVLDHQWVGDLVVQLESPDGARQVALFDRTGTVPAGFPGPFGCGGDDVDATFRDDAPLSVDEVCSITTTPVLGGSLRPNEPFSNLSGVDPAGTWTLRISDLQSGDTGSLQSATLVLVVALDCDGDGQPDECDCPADLDGNGIVGGPDLSIMLSTWGSAGPADLDGDGIVGGADLATLLSTWGSCL